MKRMNAQEAMSHFRSAGSLNHIQTAHGPSHAHASGRPRHASVPIASAHRGRPASAWSIEPRHRDTIIVSDWKLRMKCM